MDKWFFPLPPLSPFLLARAQTKRESIFVARDSPFRPRLCDVAGDVRTVVGLLSRTNGGAPALAVLQAVLPCLGPVHASVRYWAF